MPGKNKYDHFKYYFGIYMNDYDSQRPKPGEKWNQDNIPVKAYSGKIKHFQTLKTLLGPADRHFETWSHVGVNNNKLHMSGLAFGNQNRKTKHAFSYQAFLVINLIQIISTASSHSRIENWI